MNNCWLETSLAVELVYLTHFSLNRRSLTLELFYLTNSPFFERNESDPLTNLLNPFTLVEFDTSLTLGLPVFPRLLYFVSNRVWPLNYPRTAESINTYVHLPIFIDSSYWSIAVIYRYLYIYRYGKGGSGVPPRLSCIYRYLYLSIPVFVDNCICSNRVRPFNWSTLSDYSYRTKYNLSYALWHGPFPIHCLLETGLTLELSYLTRFW